jgi:hypothetical protein
VTLRFTFRLIVPLGPIAAMSAFGVLHFGIQGYFVQSPRKGCDRQRKNHPKHVMSADLVKVALSLYAAVGLTRAR